MQPRQKRLVGCLTRTVPISLKVYNSQRIHYQLNTYTNRYKIELPQDANVTVSSSPKISQNQIRDDLKMIKDLSESNRYFYTRLSQSYICIKLIRYNKLSNDIQYCSLYLLHILNFNKIRTSLSTTSTVYRQSICYSISEEARYLSSQNLLAIPYSQQMQRSMQSQFTICFYGSRIFRGIFVPKHVAPEARYVIRVNVYIRSVQQLLIPIRKIYRWRVEYFSGLERNLHGRIDAFKSR